MAVEKRVLIREVVETAYSGEHSIKVTEAVEVEVKWPESGEPACGNQYAEYGQWVLLPRPLQKGGE